VASLPVSALLFVVLGCLRELYSRGADKSLAFFISVLAAKLKEIFFDVLNKLEQRSHKFVELRGECVEQIHFFNPVACCFLYKAKDLSAPSYNS
jgi:hypothetical protein